MKVKLVHSFLFLVFIFLFSNFARAEDWIFVENSASDARYCDKNSIKRVNNNIVSVWCIKVYNQSGKRKAFSKLKKMNIAPGNADMLRCDSKLVEVDYVKRRYRITRSTIYDKNNRIIHSEPNTNAQWKDINTKHQLLKGIQSLERRFKGSVYNNR